MFVHVHSKYFTLKCTENQKLHQKQYKQGETFGAGNTKYVLSDSGKFASR